MFSICHFCRPQTLWTDREKLCGYYGYAYDDVILKNRGDAEMVLDQMRDVIYTYGFASIADLYEFAGLKSNYTDTKYGWSDLRDADIVEVRGEWLIKMPRVTPIN